MHDVTDFSDEVTRLVFDLDLCVGVLISFQIHSFSQKRLILPDEQSAIVLLARAVLRGVNAFRLRLVFWRSLHGRPRPLVEESRARGSAK